MSFVSALANKIATLGPVKTEALTAVLEPMSQELKSAGVWGPVRNAEDEKWVERSRMDFVRSATRHAVSPDFSGDLELTYRETNVRLLVDVRTDEKNAAYVRDIDAFDHPRASHVDVKALDAKLKAIAGI